MALDDFAPASEIPEPNPDGRLAGEQAADEDLFSFPATEPEPEAPVEEPASGDDLMADPPASEPVKTEIECTGLDPELDVDVFDFPPLDLSSLGVEEEPAPAIEDSIEAATQSVHALLQDDLGDSTNLELDAPHFDDDLADLPSAPSGAAQAAHASREFDAAQDQAQGRPMTTPVQVALPAGAGSSRAMWVLTGGLLVFLFGLLAIAWRATSSFQQQIEHVRAEVTTSTAEIQRETASELERLVAMQGQLLRTSAQGAPESERIPAMESPSETVMAVAQEAIENGRFADARRMLFTLLAEADRFPAESREDLERRAGFLIAASHKREALTLPEDVK